MNEQIGEIAGTLWRFLEEKGETTLTKLQKGVGIDDFLFAAALGWLAREDKIELSVKGKTKRVKLK